jgi:hypothetical protein
LHRAFAGIFDAFPDADGTRAEVAWSALHGLATLQAGGRRRASHMQPGWICSTACSPTGRLDPVRRVDVDDESVALKAVDVAVRTGGAESPNDDVLPARGAGKSPKLARGRRISVIRFRHVEPVHESSAAGREAIELS